MTDQDPGDWVSPASQSADPGDWIAPPAAKEEEYQTDPTRAAYQGLMDTVAKPINTAVNSVVSPVMGAVASAASKPAQGVADAVDSTGVGKWIGDKLMAGKEAISDLGDNIEDLESYNPDLKRDLSAFGENAQLAGNLTAVKGAGKAITSATQPAADSFAAASAANAAAKATAEDAPIGLDKLDVLKEANKGTAFASKPNALVEGLRGNQAISAAYDADKQVMSSIASDLQTEGSKFTLQMPEIYDKLNKTIDTLSNRVAPGSQEEGALRQLMDIRDNLQEKYAAPPEFKPGNLGVVSTPTEATGISPNDLVSIRKSINSGLNANKFLTAGKGQLLDLKTIVNDGLDKASEVSPEFGAHLDKFNKQAARLGLYEEDSVKPLWQPEDYVAYKAKINDPVHPGIANDTISRATTFLDNLNSTKGGRAAALSEILSPDKATPILRSAIINARRNAPSLFNAAGQLATGHPLNAAMTAVKAMFSSSKSPLVDLANQATKSGYAKGGTVNTAPSEAQKEAGNYKKEHLELHGLRITIENPKGSFRSGKDKNGKEWKVRMPAAYGYFRKTEGADGDHVDCYIGPNPESKRVWILDQKDADTGRFDEHKTFLGFKSKPQVLAIYRKAFSDGKADKRIHAITECTLEQLKEWLNKDMKRVA
jgi:hypothetical protein